MSQSGYVTGSPMFQVNLTQGRQEQRSAAILEVNIALFVNFQRSINVNHEVLCFYSAVP